MVDRDSLQLAEALNRQYRDYQEALRVLAMNPRMVSFRIEPTIEPTDEEIEDLPPASVVVPAEGIQTPPQMMTAIKDQVEARIKAINERLTGMGVAPSPPRQASQTRVSTSGGAESPPTTQKPASEPPKPASTPAKPSTSHSRGRR